LGGVRIFDYLLRFLCVPRALEIGHELVMNFARRCAGRGVGRGSGWGSGVGSLFI